MVREEVPAALAGERIDRVVAMLIGASRAQVATLIERGGVLVDGAVVAKASRRLAEGEVVEVTGSLPDTDEAPEPDPAVSVPVVYADDDLVVVDKPADLVVHPGSGNPDGTLVNGLLARFPELAGVGDPARPGIVHRLDKGTSGLLLVARSPRAYAALVEALAARTVHRGYRALVWGWPDPPTGVVDAPIGRSERDPLRMAVRADGREARTHYQVVDRFDDPVAVAELECELETGRTHQIRVHLSAIGHPVVGDARYGGRRASLPFERPWLHAERLELAHPVTGERLRFVSPLPDDLVGLRARLGRRRRESSDGPAR